MNHRSTGAASGNTLPTMNGKHSYQGGSESSVRRTGRSILFFLLIALFSIAVWETLKQPFDTGADCGNSLFSFTSSGTSSSSFENTATKETTSTSSTNHEDEPSSGAPKDYKSKVSSATSGKIFSGKVVREFPKSELLFENYRLGKVSKKKNLQSSSSSCENWAVVTTIFTPSEAIKRQVQMHNWCFVIAGDKKSPQEYETGWFEGAGIYGWAKRVVYLLPEQQLQMGYKDFLDILPFNHFARKNVGYLYAVAHGAKRVWDFDDDNLLYYWVDSDVKTVPSLDNLVEHLEKEGKAKMLEIRDYDHWSFNPYPMLHAPEFPCWPRGFPLQDIKNEAAYKVEDSQLEEILMSPSNIGVVQSLADNQPDVDALYRLTQTAIPFNFVPQSTYEARPVLVPKNALTPFNAQATLHLENALWGLLLPITVTGRVSDIWRSYFMQRIGWDIGVRVAFTSRPMVTQERNVHNIVGDLESETQLYLQANQLVAFLHEWHSSAPHLVTRIEELWVALYERAYFEKKDVLMLQQWLKALLEAGYKFPKVTRSGPLPAKAKKEMPHNKISSSGAPSKCDGVPQLKVWTADMGDGGGMAAYLADMGMEVTYLGDRSAVPSSILKKIKVYSGSLGPVLGGKARVLSKQDLDSNYKFWKNKLDTDMFLCTSPGGLCELWTRFDKKILFAPTDRYNVGKCTEETWKEFNANMREAAKKSNVIFGPLNRYDTEYLKYYMGQACPINVSPLHFPVSGYFTTPTRAKSPRSKKLLAVGEPSKGVKLPKDVVSAKSVFGSKKISSEDFASYAGVVYFPEKAASSQFSEIYASNVPVYVPSLKYFHEHGFNKNRMMAARCSTPSLNDVMKPDPSNTHLYSPNVDSLEGSQYWLQFMPIYEFPLIQYFDNMSDLIKKHKASDTSDIRSRMANYNNKFQKRLKDDVCSLLKQHVK